MTSPDVGLGGDAFRELRFALAEGDALAPSATLKMRVMAAATAARPAGRVTPPIDHIPGDDVLRRAVEELDAVLRDLDPREWSRPTIRGLDVQGLVGHLIGVETDFAAALGGAAAADGTEHISSTQAAARAEAGRPPTETHRRWAAAMERTFVALAGSDLNVPATFYGVTLPLDSLLVIRAFEMWIHQEDIRRACGRSLAPPDPARLARMTALAVILLPAGIGRTGRAVGDRTVRLVLTGSGGGTWNVPLGAQVGEAPAATRVVVDATAFCRIVGDRIDAVGAGAIVSGDEDLAADVFAGAAALALD